MKVAVLSDIHGNGVALQYAINDLKSLGISKVIVLGDVVMKGPMPSQNSDVSFYIITGGNGGRLNV